MLIATKVAFDFCVIWFLAKVARNILVAFVGVAAEIEYWVLLNNGVVLGPNSELLHHRTEHAF